MKKIDKQEHFTVPEGYFETFTEHMMNILPEQEFQPMKVSEKKRVLPLWTRYAAAACVVGVLMVSAVTAFYHDKDKVEQNGSPIAAVTTAIADSSEKVIEAVVPVTIKEEPILAKAETHIEHKSKHVSKVDAPVNTIKEKRVNNTHAAKQSYDVEINTEFDQSEIERAAMYMGIDHQDMCEILYEGI